MSFLCDSQWAHWILCLFWLYFCILNTSFRLTLLSLRISSCIQRLLYSCLFFLILCFNSVSLKQPSQDLLELKWYHVLKRFCFKFHSLCLFLTQDYITLINCLSRFGHSHSQPNELVLFSLTCFHFVKSLLAVSFATHNNKWAIKHLASCKENVK